MIKTRHNNYAQRHVRSRRAAVLPFFVVGLLVLVAFLSFAVDVMRNILAVQQLEFAAEAAALHAYAQSANGDGSYTAAQAMQNMQDALASSSGSAPWNTAQSGPEELNGAYESGVSIDSSDISFPQNPLDANEIFLRVTARRQGQDALRFFFLPAIYAMDFLASGQIPASSKSAEPYRTIEVMGQPASRIGAGSPRGSANSQGRLSGFAVLPIAISYSQFQQASSASESNQNYQIDLLDSSNPSPALSAGHIRGSFVNITATGDNLTYYGDGQGNNAISNLVSSWKYFYLGEEQGAIAPALVERGSQLNCFDVGDSVFQVRKQEVVDALKQVPTRYFILPVIDSDPSATAKKTVVGFARFKLVRAVDTTGSKFDFVFQIVDSVVLPNASCAPGISSIPANSRRTMPAPQKGGPFDSRIYSPDQDGFSQRPRGVVLAPVLSPRQSSI